MQGNDIAPYLTSTVAVMFEGLIYPVTQDEPAPAKKRRWFRTEEEPTEHDPDVLATVRRWKPMDLPLKSLIHMVDYLHIKVDVYTYYDVDYVEHIEHWLARKGAHVQVFSYENIDGLRDDFRFNRDVRTLYTPFEDDAAILGPRCTVMKAESTWGF